MTSELVGKIKFCLDYLSKLLFFSIFENLTFFHFCNTNVRKFRKMFSSPEIFFQDLKVWGFFHRWKIKLSNRTEIHLDQN